MSDSRTWTRREALGQLGMGVAGAALPEFASAAAPAFPKGSVIRMILKDYAPDELAGGATLFHEHMSFADNFMTPWTGYAVETRRENALPGAPQPGGTAQGAGRAGGPATAPPPPPVTASGKYFMQGLDFMVEEIKIAKGEGISCIVDGGHADMGRDISFLRQLSQQSGLPIVAGGGFYTQPFYPKEISTMSEEQIYQALLKQVDTEPLGCFGEIGFWDYITKDERKVFRAVGRASVTTNLPIFTHTGIPGTSALEQPDLLEDVTIADIKSLSTVVSAVEVHRRPAFGHPAARATALDEFHHDRGHARALLQALYLRDVRMVEGREDFGFTLETRESFRIRGHQGGQHLDRHRSFQVRVGGFVDFPHAPDADQRGDHVHAEAGAESEGQVARTIAVSVARTRLIQPDGLVFVDCPPKTTDPTRKSCPPVKSPLRDFERSRWGGGRRTAG